MPNYNQDKFFSRARRVGAMMVCLLVAFLTHSAFAGDQQPISLENWTTRPDIKEVRAIYDEINLGIKKKKFKTLVRRFNVDSELCSGSYPIENEALALDEKGHVRKYQFRQIVSHRESFDVEHYYDGNGKLRFTFSDRTIEKYRIYFDRNGKVFWAVETKSYFDKIHSDKITQYEVNDDDWYTKPNSATEAKEAFQEQEACPEIKK